MTKEIEVSVKKWLGAQTDCDICQESLGRFPDKPWLVDGKLNFRSSWAIMCPLCFEKYGAGIGPGKGQKYDAVTKEKIEG